jgi:hypothetical protein
VNRIDWRDDTGQVAGLESIGFGILLFVVGSLLVANAWAVLDVKMATTSAAREATRAYIDSRDADASASVATEAAQDAIASYGRNPSSVTVELPSDAPALAPCQRVRVIVRYPIPAITLPFVGGFGDGFTVTATHTEVVPCG